MIIFNLPLTLLLLPTGVNLTDKSEQAKFPIRIPLLLSMSDFPLHGTLPKSKK